MPVKTETGNFHRQICPAIDQQLACPGEGDRKKYLMQTSQLCAYVVTNMDSWSHWNRFSIFIGFRIASPSHYHLHRPALWPRKFKNQIMQLTVTPHPPTPTPTSVRPTTQDILVFCYSIDFHIDKPRRAHTLPSKDTSRSFGREITWLGNALWEVLRQCFYTSGLSAFKHFFN